MSLQKRDIEILKAIYKYRFLATSHLKQLFFGCLTRANSRLRKLWENEFLERHYLKPIVFHGSQEAIYSLGKNGVEIMADIHGLDSNTVSQSRIKSNILKPLFIGHLLDVNDFSINFTLLADNHPELKIELWLDDNDAQDEYKSSQYGKTIIRKFRPDGYGRYWHKDRLYSFFLELDRATESTTRFENKISSYIEYYDSGNYEKKFGVKLFRVLIVTTSNKRISSLKKIADETGKGIFWFTTIENIRQRKMFDAIWVRSCNSGTFSLLPSNT